MKKLLVLPLLFCLSLIGCYYDNVEELNPGMGLFETCDTTSNVSYSTHIVPIMENYCYSCHSGSNPSSGYNLDTYTDLAGWASSGDLHGSVFRRAGFNAMPPSFALDSCRMKLFENWINAGAPNN